MKEIIEQVKALNPPRWATANFKEGYDQAIEKVVAILESQQGKEQSQFQTFVDNFLSVLPEEEREKLKMYDNLPAIDLSKREQGKEEKEAVEAVSFALWIACNGYVYHSVIGKYSRNAGKLYSPVELYSQ